MKVLVPNTIQWTVSSTEQAEFVFFGPRADLPPQHFDAEILVAWDMPHEQRKKAAQKLRNLRCVQSLAAGVDKLLTAGFVETAVICSGRTLHTIPVAEHALFLLLLAARRGHEMRDQQRKRHWAEHLGGTVQAHADNKFSMLYKSNIVIWGFGSIGRYLASLLAEMGAAVTGVATSAGERAGFPVITADQLADVLPKTHALVLILPHTASTHHALDAATLAQLPPFAWVVNVGRGATVDEEALIQALEQRVIAGAALDVFASEPLPRESPLWDMDDVFISPHAAGGRPLGSEDLVLRQVEHLRAGRPLENVVDPRRGY